MKNDNLVWIDCEMTGLDTNIHTLVEIAIIVTDGSLKILDDGIDLVIHASDAELAAMDDFVTNMHTHSGLIEEIESSPLSMEEAEKQVLEYLKKFIKTPKSALLAGNSVGMDRQFIHKYMPQLDDFLHYRIIDVSSVKEIAKRWYPKVFYGKPEKNLEHRALADIRESIEELEYYRDTIFVPAPGPSTEEITKISESFSTNK